MWAMSSWATLPVSVDAERFEALGSRLRKELRSFLAGAGLQYRRTDQGRVCLRCQPTDRGGLVYARPLQNAAGQFRRDAPERLARDTVDAGLEALIPDLLAKPGASLFGVNSWGHLQLELLSATDPLPLLRTVAKERPDLRFYRVGGTDRLLRRLGFWRMLDQLLAGVDPEDMALGSQATDGPLVTGLVEVAPAALVCAPLLARFQPLAAVFQLANGGQVAMVPAHGAFARGLRLDPWPVGVGGAGLAGPGKGVYAGTVREFPSGHAEALLGAVTEGANRLLDHLTDPARWRDAGGVLDAEERWIAWTSVRLGLDAVAALGADWGGRSSLWDAFRALGTLQGVWEGAQQGRAPLRRLLDPELVQRHAVDRFPDEVHRRWATGVVANYRREVERAFPGEPLERALRRLEEVRHLVHGVGAQGRRPRTERLEVLRAFATSAPNVQLVEDVAAFWWTAVMLDPERNCRPGSAPWEL